MTIALLFLVHSWKTQSFSIFGTKNTKYISKLMNECFKIFCSLKFGGRYSQPQLWKGKFSHCSLKGLREESWWIHRGTKSILQSEKCHVIYGWIQLLGSSMCQVWVRETIFCDGRSLLKMMILTSVLHGLDAFLELSHLHSQNLRVFLDKIGQTCLPQQKD